MAHATSEFAATLLVLVSRDTCRSSCNCVLRPSKSRNVRKSASSTVMKHGWMLGLCRARKAARDAARREEKARKRS